MCIFSVVVSNQCMSCCCLDFKKGYQDLMLDLATTGQTLIELYSGQSGRARASVNLMQAPAPRTYVSYPLSCCLACFCSYIRRWKTSSYYFASLQTLASTSSISSRPRFTMAPIAITPPALESKQARPGIQRANTANMGTKRKIICFSGTNAFAWSTTSPL